MELFSSENERYLQEIEFLKKSKESEMAQHSVGMARSTHLQAKIKQLEEEKRKLESEVEILTSEKEYLQKSAEKVSSLQSRLESLKDTESKFQELKQEVRFGAFLHHSTRISSGSSPRGRSLCRTARRETKSSGSAKTTARCEASWRP